MTEETYWLKTGHDAPWRQVSKREFVAAERRAGFYNTLGQPNEPATSAFSNAGIQGRQGFLHNEKG